MIGNIITAIAIAMLTVAICIQTVRTNVTEEELEKLEDVVMKKASEVDVESIKNRLRQEIAESSNTEREIKEVTSKLLSIIDDIARLDAEIQQVKHDEKEIRSYYVNYRDPIE